jgi:hypothetical protein
MCVCACVRSAALAALAPVMPRTERHSGVRSDSEACRMACSPMVRCGCDAGEPVSACMCACVYGSDRLAQRWWVVLPTTSVSVSIMIKVNVFNGFRVYF